MNTTIKLLLVPVISIYVLWIYYFLIYTPNYRENLARVSDEIILILWEDKEIYSLKKNTITLMEDKRKCLQDDISFLCKKKKEQYQLLLPKIPSNISFYHCLWKFIVRNDSNTNSHFVAKKFLTDTDIWFIFMIDRGSWLEYSIPENRFNDAGPCYPWDDLEDYKKRYSPIFTHLPTIS